MPPTKPIAEPPAEPVVRLMFERLQYKAPFAFELAELNHETVAELLHYLFNTRKWAGHAESTIPQQIREWRKRLYRDSPESASRGGTTIRGKLVVEATVPQFICEACSTPDRTGKSVQIGDEGELAPRAVPDGTSFVPPPSDDDPDAWIEQAVEQRVAEMSWNSLAAFHKRPRATVRRVVGQRMEERGLTVGAGA